MTLTPGGAVPLHASTNAKRAASMCEARDLLSRRNSVCQREVRHLPEELDQLFCVMNDDSCSHRMPAFRGEVRAVFCFLHRVALRFVALRSSVCFMTIVPCCIIASMAPAISLGIKSAIQTSR